MSELERLVTVLATCDHPAILVQKLLTTDYDLVRRCLQCGSISHSEDGKTWKPWAPPVLVVQVCEETRKEAEEVPAPERFERLRDLIDAALLDARRGVHTAAIEKILRMDDARARAESKPIKYVSTPPGETPGATARRWAEEDLARPVEADRAPRPIVRAMCPHCDHPISRHNLPGSPGTLGTGCLVDGCKCKREIFTTTDRGGSSIAGETASAKTHTRMVGHILYGGRAFCGFMAEREPKDWPPGHYFVTLKQVTWSNSSGHGKVSIPPEFKFEPCAECVRRAEESTL